MRPETGNMRFGNDWTGVFLRGDYAVPVSFYLRSTIESIEKGEKLSVLHLSMLRGLAETLEDCRHRTGLPEAQMAVLAEKEEKHDTTDGGTAAEG